MFSVYVRVSELPTYLATYSFRTNQNRIRLGSPEGIPALHARPVLYLGTYAGVIGLARDPSVQGREATIGFV